MYIPNFIALRTTITLFAVSAALDGVLRLGAGWSSPVARQAHNLKVAGSNPAPATNYSIFLNDPAPLPSKALCVRCQICCRLSASRITRHEMFVLMAVV